MASAYIECRVIDVIRLEAGLEEALPIDATSTFNEDLGCDSLDAISIQLACEQEFDIEIDENEADRFVTVGDLIAYVARRLHPRATATLGAGE